jgi:hypothetical protein
MHLVPKFSFFLTFSTEFSSLSSTVHAETLVLAQKFRFGQSYPQRATSAVILSYDSRIVHPTKHRYEHFFAVASVYKTSSFRLLITHTTKTEIIIGHLGRFGHLGVRRQLAPGIHMAAVYPLCLFF